MNRFQSKGLATPQEDDENGRFERTGESSTHSEKPLCNLRLIAPTRVCSFELLPLQGMDFPRSASVTEQVGVQFTFYSRRTLARTKGVCQHPAGRWIKGVGPTEPLASLDSTSNLVLQWV